MRIAVGVLVAVGACAWVAFWLINGTAASPPAETTVTGTTSTANDRDTSPIVSAEPAAECKRRAAEIEFDHGTLTRTEYRIRLHEFQRDCPREARFRGLAAETLPRCARPDQDACTLYMPPAWLFELKGKGTEVAMTDEQPFDGAVAVAVREDGGSGGSAYVALAEAVRIDPSRAYIFSAYWRRASGSADATGEMQLACFDAQNRFLGPAPIWNLGLLGPATGITGLSAGAVVQPGTRWQRFGGFVAPRSWPRRTARVLPQLLFFRGSDFAAEVHVDAVELRPGLELAEFTRESPNIVPDPSFDLGFGNE